MRADGAAVVHLSPHAAGEPDVGVDNTAGIAGMVEALVELGHRQIAFLAGPRALIVSQRRLDGYQKGLESAGIPYDDRLVLRTTFDRDGGALAVDTLLAGEVPFTAICCANDLLALGALARLAERGIQVPGDVSVAGFDDIAVAAMTAPSLSTVRLPLRELGRRGYHHADQLLAGMAPAPETLPTELVLRASTGAPPAIPLPAAPLPASLPAATTAPGASA
jgi:LacI family transcriptional regulator